MKPSIPRALTTIAAVALAATAVAACGGSDPAAESSAASDARKTEFSIGAASDSPTDQDLLEFVAKEVAPKHGITIKTRVVNDSTALNDAVDHNELDGNIAQHKPYLESVAPDHGWKLAALVPVYNSKRGFYSKKLKSLDEVADGTKVAIADDPSNEAQGLGALQAVRLVKMDASVDAQAWTPRDIVANPKHLKIQPLAWQQLGRALDDVDFVTGKAAAFRDIGLDPKYRIADIKGDPTYATQLVVRSADVNTPAYRKLADVFRDPALAGYIQKRYGDMQDPLDPQAG